MKYWATLAAAAAFAISAEAGPITTPPSVVSVNGNVVAMFLYANAWDTSELRLMTSPMDPIFCNHSYATCTAASAGDTADLGAQTGTLNFWLYNVTKNKTYSIYTADGNGYYHAKVSTDYSVFNVGTLSPAIEAALAGYDNVTFVGFEDKEKSNGTDWDFNDLIFAFATLPPNNNPGVPEPLTLALMGAGLAGAFGLRRITKKS